jgi:hypothetical protein
MMTFPRWEVTTVHCSVSEFGKYCAVVYCNLFVVKTPLNLRVEREIIGKSSTSKDLSRVWNFFARRV